MAECHLSAARVRELVRYVPETGEFFSISARSHRRKVGKANCGYQRLYLDGRNYRAHRIAWLYMTGDWPPVIDHINGNGCDNRWENLRLATVQLNNQNLHGARSNSLVGRLGVSMNKGGRYTAIIGAHLAGRKVQIYLGAYDTADEAAAVYLDAKRKLHAGCTI